MHRQTRKATREDSARPDGSLSWPWLAAIFGVAILYRAVCFATIGGHPLLTHPTVDAGYHHDWARRIVAGDWLGHGQDDVFKPPLYPYFLAGLYALFGVHIGVAQWAQIVMDAASCALIAMLAGVLLGRRVALLAGFIGALYAPYAFFDLQLLTPPLSILLNTGALLLLTRAWPGARWLRLLAAGALLGLSTVVRPDVLLPAGLALAVLVWLDISAGGGIRGLKPKALQSSAAKASTVALGIGLMILPVTVRNYRLTGQFIPVSSNAGINFYVGNVAGDGTAAVPVGLPWERLVSRVPQKTLERPADASRFWFRETRREMRQYPGRAAANLGRKALAFFSAREFRNNIGFDFVQALGWPLRLPFVQFGLLLPLAAWGLVSLRSDRSQAARLTGNLCLAWVGGYFLGGVVYFVTDRYRMPAVPLLVVSAAYGVVSLVDAFRQRRHDAILKATFVVIASGVVIWPGWFGDARSGWADDYITLGNSLREAGDTSGAARAYRQAVSMSPRNADACFHVGQLLADKPRDAIPWLERARGASPDSPDVLLELAKAYSTLGFSPKARETLEHLVGLGDRCNLWPRRAAWATAHVLLAPLDPTEADRHWQRAWDIDPRTAAEISFLYHRDINRVVSTFESLAGENPWDWYSQANYGLSLLAAGRPDDAEAPLRRAARLAPEREALRFHLARALLLAGKRDEAVAILDALARTLPDCDLKPQVDRALAEAKANPTPGR